MKWKIWTLFNNWFSVINNLKIFYKESQTQYFTNFALFFFVFFFFFKLHLYKRMERRHGLVPRKEGAKSSTHTNIHTHTRTRKKRKTKKKKKTFWHQISNLSTVLYSYIFLNFTESLTEFTLFFFSLNCCCYFFHTRVKHGHIAPDYRLQNHIHTCLSHIDAPTQRVAARVGGGEGRRFVKTRINLL